MYIFKISKFQSDFKILKYREELIKHKELKSVVECMSKRPYQNVETTNGKEKDSENCALKKCKPNVPKHKLILSGGTFGNNQTRVRGQHQLKIF